MLNEEQKKQLLKSAEDFDVDVHDLESFRYDSNIYMTEAHLATSGYDFDENELWEHQIRKLIDEIDRVGVYEYCKMSEDDIDIDCETREFTNEAIVWLKRMIGE